jgi:alpha-tubulin suppressor-like RCC1 family protein
VWAWGKNEFGHLWTGKNSAVPIQVEGIRDVIVIAAGGNHTVALKNEE